MDRPDSGDGGARSDYNQTDDEGERTLSDELGAAEAVAERLAERFGADEANVGAGTDRDTTVRLSRSADSFGEAVSWAQNAADVLRAAGLDANIDAGEVRYDADEGDMVAEPHAEVRGSRGE